MQNIQPASTFEEIGAAVGRLVAEKHNAYGDSLGQCAEFAKLLYPDGVPVAAYQEFLGIVRIWDKLKRIATNNDPSGESPFVDIIGYAILSYRDKFKRDFRNEAFKVGTEEDFFSQGKRTESGCLEWTGARDAKGYGYRHAWGRQMLVHRVCYQLLNGPIPPDREIMHICDNPPCFAPEHLKLGTHTDNMRDMARKGRASKGHGTGGGKINYMHGTAHCRSTLSDADIVAIRNLAKLPVGQRKSHTQIANAYGVSQAAVTRIINRQTYKDIP